MKRAGQKIWGKAITSIITALVVMLPLLAPAQNLFVVNNGSNTIEVFTNNGGMLSTNRTVFANSNSGLASPSGLAFDSNGNLYVANTANNIILEFTNSNGLLSTNGTVFANSGLNYPYGLAFDSNGNLYVANYLSGTIEKFTYTAGILNSNGATFINFGLSNPTGLAFDGSGNLYVANLVGFGDSTIEVFTNNAGTLSTNGTTFADSLSSPFSLAFDGGGNLYMADIYGYKIEKFANSGGTLNSNGATFANLGQISPTGLAIDGGGNLYAAYTADGFDFRTNATIERFSLAGNDLGPFAITGNKPFYMAFQPPMPIPLNIRLAGANVVLTWTNSLFTLQAAPTITGSFTNVSSATSPYTNAVTSSQQFFRLQGN